VHLATHRRRIPAMKNITLYKPNGDSFKDYRDVVSYEATNGVLIFLWARMPGNERSAERVITSLPFFVEDDYKHA
jgi:hypothetical protein